MVIIHMDYTKQIPLVNCNFWEQALPYKNENADFSRVRRRLCAHRCLRALRHPGLGRTDEISRSRVNISGLHLSSPSGGPLVGTGGDEM